MGQRTDSRAFYNEGVWKARDARYREPDRFRTEHTRRDRPEETGSLPHFKGKPPGWHAAFAVAAVRNPRAPIGQLDRQTDAMLLGSTAYKQPEP